ncbi:MAG TPA: carboxypeptidase-like regulatory domain-containing protein, partial [Edaphobacter sp.]|nr:carboxypeptidase-like regulatory domain-containing protein [Edaphobacter sp.]
MVLLILGGTRWGFAQTAFSVRGSVFDPSGAAIPGATVQLQSPDGAVVSQSQTGPKGDFTLLNVPAGNFSLVVPAYSGFASGTLPLRLTGNVTGIKVTLTTESVQQEITVGADQSLSTDPSANRDTITTTGGELRKLPVFDQDYIAALTPFLDASSGSSGGATIIVDGVEMKSAGVSASAIQEVRVNNDPYSAEFNRPGRGRIEIITKPGSPVFHGEANFIFRDAVFNAKNHFSPVRPPEARRIYEGHIAGPVGRGGHTGFIASASYRQQNTAAVVNAIGPIGPSGPKGPIIGPINENVLTPNRNSQYSIRMTHDFSPNHR